VGEGWGEGEYTMSPPPSPSPIKREGRWVEFSLFVSDEFIMNN
jgi:hypothetical protein